MVDAWLALQSPRIAWTLAVAALSAVLLALMAAGAWSVVRRRGGMAVLCVWSGVHMLTYVAIFPNSGHGGRYQPLYLMLAFPLMFLGLRGCLQRMGGGSRVPVAAIVAVAIGVGSIATWRTVTLDGLEHINNTEGRMATWVNENVPAGTAVASFDIGRISYDRTRGPVVDMGGLADPAFVPYLTSGRTAEFLNQQHVEFAVVPEGMLPVLNLQEAVGPPLAEFCSPPEVWRLGYATTHHAARCQSVYAFHVPMSP
jgi:hypothetical protein